MQGEGEKKNGKKNGISRKFAGEEKAEVRKSKIIQILPTVLVNVLPIVGDRYRYRLYACRFPHWLENHVSFLHKLIILFNRLVFFFFRSCLTSLTLFLNKSIRPSIHTVQSRKLHPFDTTVFKRVISREWEGMLSKERKERQSLHLIPFFDLYLHL